MRVSVTGLLILALAVAGCSGAGNSRYNPMNWFGSSRDAPTATTTDPEIQEDGRVLATSITALEIARQPGGAILRANALPPTQGWWKAGLVAENDGEPVDGVMTYRFVLASPLTDERVSSPQSRELTAAIYLSDIKLSAIREIVVVGIENSRSIRR